MNRLSMTITITALLTLLLVPAAAQQPPEDFSSYPATEKFAGAAPKLVLQSKQDREFRTELRNAVKQPVNFAGRYILTTFGCGSSCVMAAIIDPGSGRVQWLPFTVCCGDYSKEKPIDFRHNSTLLVIKGMRNEQGKGTYYYQFRQGSLKLIAERPE